MINQQILQGNWNEIKGRLRRHWGQLTNDDLQVFNGNVDQLVGVIQRKTGEAREAVQQYLEDLTSDESSSIGAAAQTVSEYATQAADSIHGAYDQVADRVRSGYGDAEALVRSRPTESLAVAFGVGVIAGLIVGLVIRAR